MPKTTDELINGIEMYVLNRQIGIAEVMAKEFSDNCSFSPLLESGYAILSVLVSYFEMIAQFINGEESDKQSKIFFVQGFKAVYPNTTLSDEEIKEKIYKPVRCGMYHGGMTKAGVHLSRYLAQGILVHNGLICINPAKVVEEIRQHFCGYVTMLRNFSNTKERENFAKLCREIGADVEQRDIVSMPNAYCMTVAPSTTMSTTPCHTTPAPFHPGAGDRQ